MKTITRNCNECQIEYEAEPRYLNRGQGLFCSQSCAQVYHGRLRRVKHEPNTMCAWCGIDFYRKVSSKKSKTGYYYCSREHQALGATNHVIHTSGKPFNGGHSAKTPKQVTCWFCSELLFRNTKEAKGLHVSCRHSMNLAYTINAWLSGDNSVTLNRSRTTGKPVDTKSFVKEYLLETRGSDCEQCIEEGREPFGQEVTQMDHINGNCFDNRLENLKLLCPTHHAMTPTYGSRNKGSGRAHRRK